MKKSVKRYTKKQIFFKKLVPGLFITIFLEAVNVFLIFLRSGFLSDSYADMTRNYYADAVYAVFEKYGYDIPDKNVMLRNYLEYLFSAPVVDEDGSGIFGALLENDTFEPVIEPSDNFYLFTGEKGCIRTHYKNGGDIGEVYVSAAPVKKQLVQIFEKNSDKDFYADAAYTDENGSFFPEAVIVSDNENSVQRIAVSLSEEETENYKYVKFDHPCKIVPPGSYYGKEYEKFQSDLKRALNNKCLREMYSLLLSGTYPDDFHIFSLPRERFQHEIVLIHTESRDYHLLTTEKTMIRPDYKKIFLRPLVIAVFGSGFLIIWFLSALILSWFEYYKLKSHYDTEDFRQELTLTMAHDLKTPLMAASGYAENLLNNTHPDKNTHYAESILADIQHMDTIITDILDLSKFESGNALINKVPISLEKLTEEMISKYSDNINEKNIVMKINGNKTISADEILMKRLIENLVSNAVKYSENDSLINIDITEKYFSVSNRSPDHEITEIKNLLKPFVKGDRSRNTKTGVGLGLSIAKNICDLHGFSISISSENNIFTTKIKY